MRAEASPWFRASGSVPQCDWQAYFCRSSGALVLAGEKNLTGGECQPWALLGSRGPAVGCPHARFDSGFGHLVFNNEINCAGVFHPDVRPVHVNLNKAYFLAVTPKENIIMLMYIHKLD